MVFYVIFFMTYKKCIKIAWANEPKVIHSELYEKMQHKEYHEHFRYCLTHNQEFIKYLNDNTSCKAVWYPNGGSWFFKNRWGLERKKTNLYPLLRVIKTGQKATD